MPPEELFARASDACNQLRITEEQAALVVSHDAAFLDAVCSDIVLFTAQGTLTYHEGNFGAFKRDVLQGDEAAALKLFKRALRIKPDCAAASQELRALGEGGRSGLLGRLRGRS